jgi:serine/threonine-protein kinase SRPK3
MKALKWPEEDLTLTAEEGGGFYPLRLGECLDDQRFIIISKLGWGGFSSVWLARDRKYVQAPVLSKQIADSSKPETTALLPSKSYQHMHPEKLNLVGSENVTFLKGSQILHLFIAGSGMSFIFPINFHSRVLLASTFASSWMFLATVFRV